MEQYHHGKFTLECGFRYDYRWLRVYERNQTTLDLYNVTYQYTNATGTLGASYKASDYLRTSLNIGKGWRAPSINEMYIYGEHFSDGSFEVGDSTLKTEHTINTGWSVRYAKGKLQILTDAYCNLITNYIYDKPALKYRVLPSGTFPEFDFTQANVVIAGLDADLRYEVSHRFTLQSKTTIVRGYNESINNWLISMPCDRFENGIEFHLPEIGSLQQPYLSVVNVSVMKQIRVPPNSDYVPPPGAYSLMNMTAGFSVPMGGHLLAISITANNLLNTVYRDYLDHFRYYSDEIGANYIIRFKYSF